ncbi:MAG TPA: hypothetical protein VMT03_11435 [Polyangia bacterium]|nr:hypothetical protein [Polyangia bacterium]
MKANRSRTWSLGALVLGGFLAGAPLVARAGQPETAEEAQQRADHFNDLARSYRFQGGALWKTGHVQRAEASASSCETVANAMRSSTVVAAMAPTDQALSDAGAVVAVIVPNDKPAPSSPRCPAP